MARVHAMAWWLDKDGIGEPELTVDSIPWVNLDPIRGSAQTPPHPFRHHRNRSRQLGLAQAVRARVATGQAETAVGETTPLDHRGKAYMTRPHRTPDLKTGTAPLLPHRRIASP